MERSRSKRPGKFRPAHEACEPRLLLSGSKASVGTHPSELARPNIPVAPYGASLTTVSFIDLTASIVAGTRASIGQQSLIGPYARVDARGGHIEIGDNSAILDNATVKVSAGPGARPGGILIGSYTEVGFGAIVEGQSNVGYSASPSSSNPTSIGPNALIDGATIEPGSIVSALARVGPGVDVPSGFVVLPGVDVTTNAEASDPALGFVRKITPADIAALTIRLRHDALLAQGYATLDVGNSASGTSPGVYPALKGVYNANQTSITGASEEPGSANGPTFEPSKNLSPEFLNQTHTLAPGTLFTYPHRITGEAYFTARPKAVAGSIGKRNAIRADDGQPIRFASAPSTGNAVTIDAPGGSTTTTISNGTTTQISGGAIQFGSGIQLAGRVVVLGGPPPVTVITTTTISLPGKATTTTTTPSGVVATTTTTPTITSTTTTSTLTGTQTPNYSIGAGVVIGQGAVIDRSNIGAGAQVGARSSIEGSTIPAGAVVPAGTIFVNNKLKGLIQW